MAKGGVTMLVDAKATDWLLERGYAYEACKDNKALVKVGPMFHTHAQVLGRVLAENQIQFQIRNQKKISGAV